MIDKSLFASSEVSKHEIELADGSKHVFHFKPLVAADYGVSLAAFLSESVDMKADAIARAVSKAVCDADGKPVLTGAEVARLKPEVLNRLWSVVWEMNYQALAEGEAEKS